MVLSGGDGRQWHPKWVAYVQSTLISFSLLLLQKTLPNKDRMLELEAGFSVLLWHSRIFCLDFNLEHMEIWSCSKHTFKPPSFSISSSWFCSSMDKVDSPGLVTNRSQIHSFLPNSGVFCGCEEMLKVFWKLRQGIMHQLGESKPWLSLFQNLC